MDSEQYRNYLIKTHGVTNVVAKNYLSRLKRIEREMKIDADYAASLPAEEMQALIDRLRLKAPRLGISNLTFNDLANTLRRYQRFRQATRGKH
jgi:hypothetical protein